MKELKIKESFKKWWIHWNCFWDVSIKQRHIFLTFFCFLFYIFFIFEWKKIETVIFAVIVKKREINANQAVSIS